MRMVKSEYGVIHRDGSDSAVQRVTRFERFHLDVSADDRAVNLYQRVGFAVSSTRSLAGMTYHAMVLEKNSPTSGARRRSLTMAPERSGT